MTSFTFKILVLCGVAITALSFSAFAQDAAAPISDTSAQPLEISADKALEWDRVNKKYFARGNAIAKQKDMQVQADLLVADYREGKDKKSEIYRLTATGHVVLTSGINKGYGENAVYEIDTAKATMTGTDLRIESPEMKITAKEKFEYYSNEGKMIAYGSPQVINKDSTLDADLITAWTNPDAKKDTPKTDTATPEKKLGNLKRAEAEGHVIIVTPKEKATADKAIYTGDNDTVELHGDVKLYQGENMLEGSKADMNLTTNLSRIYGSPEKGGRVKGVFFPGSKSDKALKDK